MRWCREAASFVRTFTRKWSIMKNVENYAEMKRVQRQIIRVNETLNDRELLNWAMNQLFRAARTLDLVTTDPNNVVGCGCDATATVILKRLVKTKRGYNLVKTTNKKLLRGYAKP
jgi:hypothetical protein